MNSQESKQSQWYARVSLNFQNVPREALRFYNIQTVPRLLYALDQKKEECKECASWLEKINSQLDFAGEWVKNDAPEVKSFQKDLQKALNHLNDSHKIVARGLWLSRITVAGILIGIIPALILHRIRSEMRLHELLMLTIATGMIIGWFAGKITELILKRKGRIF